MKAIYLEPSTISEVDTEVVLVKKETWEEVADKLETLLDQYYLDYGWNGELNIKIQFKNLTQDDMNDLVEIGD